MKWINFGAVAICTSLGLSLLSGGAAGAQSISGLAVGFDDKGIASLKFGGAELLEPGPMALTKLDLRHDYPPEQMVLPAEEPDVAFDTKTHRLTETYLWGEISCVFHANGDKLNLDVEVRNTTKKESIFGITASVLQLHIPGKVTTHGWAHGWPTPSVLNDAPQVFDAEWAGGTMAICNEQVDRPLWLNLEKVGDDGKYNLVFRQDGPPRGREIGGGNWRDFSISLRFGLPGAPAVGLAQDIYQRYAEKYPPEMTWEDRRPIGCCFVSSMDFRSATNPTGWLHDKTVDMTTEAGRAAWKKRMLALADKSVSVAKDMNCQGVIVWDVEGQRNAQPISYIGDPRLLPALSPEMDAIADQFFKKYSDAGLRRGVTIRPTQVVPTPGGKEAWEHINVEDIVAELAAKIEYASKRWGCTLFYVDSTVRWDMNSSGEFALHTLPAEIFQSLHRQFPDVLLIPEESSTRHFAYTAPYHEIMPPQDYCITPPDVRAAYPKAFMVIRVADAPLIEKDAERLVAGVRSGDIIMFRTWLDDPDNVPVRRILEEAGVLKAAQ